MVLRICEVSDDYHTIPENTVLDPKLKKSVAILGATGSIGTGTLDVMRSLGKDWQVIGLSAHKKLAEAVQASQAARPRYLAATCAPSAAEFDFSGLPAGTEVLTGPESLIQLATCPEVGTVVAAVVGSAGLLSTLAAAKAGKRLRWQTKRHWWWLVAL